jgi:addiction module HigA family antidote
MIHDYSRFAAPLPHPGEILREDFLSAYKLSAGGLAKAMGLKDRTRVERIVRCAQPVTADTALRLGRVFGTSPDLWINLQTAHDLSVAAIAAGAALDDIRPLTAA